MKSLVRHQRLIGVLGTVLASTAFLLGVLRPGQMRAASLKADVTRIQSQLSALPLQIAEREHLQAKLTNLREDSIKLETLAPLRVDTADVLREVAQLAKASQVTISRLEPMPYSDFAAYSAIPFSIGCKGDFSSVAKFLSGLEQQPRLVTFGEVVLTRTGDPKDRQVQASLSFSVYSRHANSSRTAENATSPARSPSDN